MERGAWKNPVVLEIHGRPGAVLIRGTVDAALLLIGAWPTKRTQSHMAAAVTCRDVLRGRCDAGLARANFIDAALEAGYRVQPETFLNQPWEPTSAPTEMHSAPVGLADMIRKRSLTAHSPIRSTGEAVPQAAPEWPEDRRTPSFGERRETLRDLLGRLLSLLALIGLEIGRSAGNLLGAGLARRTGSQIH